MKLLLITISALLLLPNFFNIHLEQSPQYDHKELFDPGLTYSTDKLIATSDSFAAKSNVATNSFSYALIVLHLLKERFYHGFSRYPLNQNWIAARGEYFFGYGLASIVKPDDIMKYSFGGCSQQSLVLMEVMKRKNIPYRFVGFPHHYATELMFDGKWYFFDPDMEDNIPDSDRLESKWACCAESLKKYYDTARFKDLDWKFGKSLHFTPGNVNAPTAPNASLFHTTTKYLSKTLWLFPLLVVFASRKKVSNRTKYFTPRN